MTNSETGEALLSADDFLSRPEDNEYALRCPLCSEATGLHIDGVVFENAAGQRLEVGTDGDDGSRLDMRMENGHTHSGRRHQISLVGSCEHCADKFSIGFRQHKGFTYFSKAVVSQG